MTGTPPWNPPEGGAVGRRALLPALALAACAGAGREPVPAPPPGVPAAWLVQISWHTEVALPLRREEALARLLAPFLPEAPLVAFGFGARGFFTAREPGLAELSGALLPGPGALLAVPMAAPPTPDTVEDAVPLPLAGAAHEAVAAFLLGEFERDAAGRPRPIRPGFRPGAWFFEARRRYALPYTSNTWAVEALAAGGLPLDPSGVMTAGAAMREARRAARRLMA
ncbi:DUF2459 domain-containing protein [Crenalkalicoccus roseus]|uniref:DUF2459 domain-containing protein n=1 Tax=Crenalkalicoccus roseus TaxID=1485588 RepID=UPI0013052356|nr:DUF2459 domain-containing protein [Crenalkalicoccus roseus]